jgi:ATP sulfurylase
LNIVIVLIKIVVYCNNIITERNIFHIVETMKNKKYFTKNISNSNVINDIVRNRYVPTEEFSREEIRRRRTDAFSANYTITIRDATDRQLFLDEI